MKKKLLFVGALISTSLSFGQTIFSEDFESSTALPAGWAMHDVDNLTPYGATVPKGWFFDTWDTGTSAISTSWYNPIGQANDWLVTPLIAIPAAGYSLQFDITTQSTNYADGYSVYISTTGQAVADFSTAILTVAAATTSWVNKTIDLSAYNGQSIYVAIRNNSNDKTYLALDNVVVRKLLNDDAILVSSALNRYSLVNTINTLSMSIKNDGLNTITSLTVDWNDGASHTSVISCNIAPGATATVNHPTAVSYSAVIEENLNITVTHVNSTTDPNMGNNVGAKAFNTVSALVEKNVLFEEGTGTWCQWCPRGAVAMKKAYVDHPTGFIGIAVHNGDPMAVTAYDNGANFDGYPSANVDREDLGIDASTEDFDTYYASRITMVPPAAIGATITNSGATYSIVASATFKTVYSAANLRLAAIISEDDVTGTTSGYNQANAYAGNAAGVMGGFESLPNPVPAASMSYPHVGRALLGGFNGQASSVPTVITDGQVVPYTFNYTVPSTSNVANMHVVVVLIDQATGVIVNAKEFVLNPSAGITSVSKDEFKLNVYPNPASDLINVSFEAKNNDYVVNVSDLTGRTVISNNYSNLSGAQSITVPVNELLAGTYLVTVSTEGASYTQQVVIK